MNEQTHQNAQTPEQKREIIERVYQLWIKHPEKRLGELISITDQHYRRDYNLIEELEWQRKHDPHTGQEIEG